MMGPRRRTWPHFSPCNTPNSADINESQKLSYSSNKTNPNSELVERRRDSTGSCPAWSMSSFMAICPYSPSPNCSPISPPYSIISNSPSSDIFYSQISTEFSTPRNKRTCTMSKGEIEEEMNNVNHLCSFHQPNSKSKDPNEGENVEQEYSPKCPSYYSSEHQSFDTCQPFIDVPLLVDTEEPVEDKSHIEDKDSDSESPVDEHHSLMTRPKSYHAFLDEIKKKDLEEQIKAWKGAKQLKLIDKLREKMGAIDAWKLKHSKKAIIDRKKIESKLERKRVKAIDKMQKIQRKADEKKARERCSTLKKLSRISNADYTKNHYISSKLLCFW